MSILSDLPLLSSQLRRTTTYATPPPLTPHTRLARVVSTQACGRLQFTPDRLVCTGLRIDKRDRHRDRRGRARARHRGGGRSRLPVVSGDAERRLFAPRHDAPARALAPQRAPLPPLPLACKPVHRNKETQPYH